MPVMVVSSTVSVNVGSNHQRHFPLVQKNSFSDGKQTGMGLYSGIFWKIWNTFSDVPLFSCLSND